MSSLLSYLFPLFFLRFSAHSPSVLKSYIFFSYFLKKILDITRFSSLLQLLHLLLVMFLAKTKVSSVSKKHAKLQGLRDTPSDNAHL